MYKLGIFVAVLFAAAKLRRLAFCVYLWIQRRMHPWRPISPKHVREWASSLRWLPFFRICMEQSQIQPQRLIHVTCYTPTQAWWYWRKCCVTYLLVEWWHFIIINTKMNFATETRPLVTEHAIHGSAVTSSNNSTSFTTTSINSWRHLWS